MCGLINGLLGREGDMTEILEFLVRYCAFLWSKGRYRITESEAAASFGGDAYLIVSSDKLRMRFVRDRGQLFLDFQEFAAAGKEDWYSIDLLYRIVMGERRESSILNEEYAAFLREFLDKIESLFADGSVCLTSRSVYVI